MKISEDEHRILVQALLDNIEIDYDDRQAGELTEGEIAKLKNTKRSTIVAAIRKGLENGTISRRQGKKGGHIVTYYRFVASE